MIGEIIAVGDELTTGRILNTTSSFAAGHLYGAGHDIVSMATIGDDPKMIETALVRALDRADFIIITGGLGATSDDLTNEAVAKTLERPTIFYPEIFKKISGADKALTPDSICSVEDESKQKAAGGDEAAGHPLEKLAWLPAGSKVLKPEAKMAGHLLVHKGTPIFFLPGVPHEMRELMIDCVLPYLAAWRGGDGKQIRQKIYKVFGLPEVDINQQLKHLEGNDPNIAIGYYPVYPEVHVSLTIKGCREEEVQNLFERFDKNIFALLSSHLYGTGADTMESVVGDLLSANKLTVAVAESCTGGLIGHKLTRVPGSSAYFLGGVIAYSDVIKQEMLGVDPAILSKKGAVSASTARAMAKGVRKATGADIGIAVTGIAGPDGGTNEKPVGLVYFGLDGPKGTEDFKCQFVGDRWKIQKISAQKALDLVRQQFVSIV